MEDSQEAFLRKLRATFQAEAAEHVQAIVAELVVLERAAPDEGAPVAQRILQTLHTLKGAARAVNMEDLELLCHAMESLCGALRAQAGAPAAGQFDLLHQACELITALLADPGPRTRNKSMALVRQLEAQAAAAPQAAPAPPEPAPPEPEPPEADLPEAAAQAVQPRPDMLRIHGRDLDAVRHQAEALLSVELVLSHQAALLGELAGRMLEQRGAGGGEDFFEQVRKAGAELHGACVRMGAVRSKLMEAVLDTAMVPFSSALDQLPGMVRKLARARGKEAVLSVRGDSLHVDRRILEVVREAVLHIVTNAVDHGIEDPAGRSAAGKPREGQVQVTVEQVAGSRVLLTVADDGAGIDVDAVVRAALEAGAVSPAQLDVLDGPARLLLALRAGVSTSGAVDQVSGRGVGLAIVADRVAAAGGELLVDSRPGRGCRFELALPVRVATLRALLVRCGDGEYALPLQGLEEVQKVAPDAVRTVQERETLVRAGRVLPLVRLGRLLEQPDAAPGAAQVAVIARAGAGLFALLVDDVIGEQSIVPKNLGKQLRRVRYFSGATQLGTGALLPVLALDDIARHALAPALAPATPMQAGPARRAAARVLAVEDSITSRLLLKHILEGAGYQVDTAADGLDAQSRLRREQFDAVVSDIEMPRMDGLALTRSIRADPRTRDLPVVLVTSLQTAEERERGLQAGADAYVVKGAFDQDNLLATLRRLM